MKAKAITINAVQFENGHIMIGRTYNNAFIRSDDGSIHEYTKGEMKEVYGYEL
jgi:hypothetical protein